MTSRGGARAGKKKGEEKTRWGTREAEKGVCSKMTAVGVTLI